MKSGIRQGCLLSALLFVTAVEILSINIRNNDEIQGIKIGEDIFKISQLADDTTLFLKDVDSLKTTIKLLSYFMCLSGLKLNESKTEILQKNNLLKTLFISKLNLWNTWYFIESAKDIFENILWSNKLARVKNDILNSDYDQGGPKIPNLNNVIKSQKINWIKKLIDNRKTLPYAYVSTFFNMPIE